jgi:type II secretory pathway component GspD/PulD (secretin)
MRSFFVLMAGLFLAGTAAAQEAPPPAGQLVAINVLLADAVGPAADGAEITAAKIVELDKQGKLSSASRISLSLLENLPASAQFGENAPLVTGRQEGGFPGGGRSSMYSMQNLGTTVQATARVEQDGKILVELTVERSRLAPAKPAEGDAAPEPRRIIHQNTRTSVRVASGSSVLVGGQQSVAGGDATQTYVVLTATVAEPAKAAAAEAARPAAELKVFTLTHARASDILQVLQSVFQRQGLRLAADERTNSIIAQGAEDQLEIARALIQRLDES